MLGENNQVEKWIVLSLENTSSDLASEINLFDIGINYDGSTKYTSGIFEFRAGNPANWTVTSAETGAVAFSGNYQSMDDVLTAINATFTENGVGVFTYVTTSPSFYRLIAYSNDYTFTKVVPYLFASQNFTSSASLVSAGSSIIVTSESPISMNEITQELVYQPYKLLTTNVYATSATQANKQLELRSRDRSGKLLKTFSYPTINPIQNQFALEDVELDYLPSPTNKLTYTLEPRTTVKLIVKYEHTELTIDSEDQLVLTYSNNTKDMKTQYIQVKNPLIGLVLKQDRSFTPIAKIVGELVDEEKGMTFEQFYSAFDGKDFVSANS